MDAYSVSISFIFGATFGHCYNNICINNSDIFFVTKNPETKRKQKHALKMGNSVSDSDGNRIQTEDTYLETKKGVHFYRVRYAHDWKFRNVKGTSFYSKKKGFSSWLGQYRKHIGPVSRCFSCDARDVRLVGGHMKRKDKLMDINNHHIIPICDSCNNYKNDEVTEVKIKAGHPLLVSRPNLQKRIEKGMAELRL